MLGSFNASPIWGGGKVGHGNMRSFFNGEKRKFLEFGPPPPRRLEFSRLEKVVGGFPDPLRVNSVFFFLGCGSNYGGIFFHPFCDGSGEEEV